jgi:ATP-binding protein involved in chromosome partitioning
MREEARNLVTKLEGVKDVTVSMTAEVRPHAAPDKSSLTGISNIVAIGSGKGGVGKSTVTANLAVALAQAGARVGLLDADIYGPSIPTMMGVKQELQMTPDKRIVPHTAHGVRFMSMGYFAPGDKPMIWRGPMAHKALQEQLFRVDWGALDYLLVDLPPGTGDVHITLAQSVALTGAAIVSTPQDVGLMISMKTLRMFQTTNVHILGLIENMSYYQCSHCGNREEIFGHGAVAQASQNLGIPFLGEIPIDTRIRIYADTGRPMVLAEPNSVAAKAYREIAERLAAQVSIRNFGMGQGEQAHHPREIKVVGEKELWITWGDGHNSIYPLQYLREQCPCAACVDEWTREKRLRPGSISPNIKIVTMEPVGQYAVRIHWSDGHNTGIYSFENLRKLCPCGQCVPVGNVEGK